jgi:CheY-like chemotaxis protein
MRFRIGDTIVITCVRARGRCPVITVEAWDARRRRPHGRDRNARDAIALATRGRPHVIVSDIAMVGEDGYWLVRELKRLPAEMLDDIPVVAATAYGREHPRARVLAAGFTEHLQKPIDPEQLCQIVARVAAR